MTDPEPIHPGEHLAEIMEELGITPYRFAKTIIVPPVRKNAVIKRHRSIPTDTVLRMGRALGYTPENWLKHSRMYDLDVARVKTDITEIGPLVDSTASTLSETNPSIVEALRSAGALVRTEESKSTTRKLINRY